MPCSAIPCEGRLRDARREPWFLPRNAKPRLWRGFVSPGPLTCRWGRPLKRPVCTEPAFVHGGNTTSSIPAQQVIFLACVTSLPRLSPPGTSSTPVPSLATGTPVAEKPMKSLRSVLAASLLTSLFSLVGPAAADAPSG